MIQERDRRVECPAFERERRGDGGILSPGLRAL